MTIKEKIMDNNQQKFQSKVGVVGMKPNHKS